MHILSAKDGAAFLDETICPKCDERIALNEGLRKLFDDGFSALASNEELDDAVRASARNGLEEEQHVCDRVDGSFCVVNGDAWSNRIDAEQGRPFTKSVDLLVPVDEVGLPCILFAEGKLGLAPREHRSRLRNPRYADVVEKYKETKAKISRGGEVAVCRTMDLIVPHAVREVARSTFARRNMTNGDCHIVPLDVLGFLADIGVAARQMGGATSAGVGNGSSYNFVAPKHCMEVTS